MKRMKSDRVYAQWVKWKGGVRMAKDGGGNSGLDLARIEFPLDAVTWRQIRMNGKLSLGDLESHRVGGLEIISGHSFEIELAQSAFNEASGTGPVMSRDERRTCEWALHTSYLHYGISKGERESAEMIRRFVNEARRQGIAHRGTGR